VVRRRTFAATWERPAGIWRRAEYIVVRVEQELDVKGSAWFNSHSIQRSPQQSQTSYPTALAMAPARIESPVPWSTAIERVDSRFEGPPRNIDTIDAVEFSANLQPKEYSIFGTHEKSKILFLNVQILDSTGKEPYSGDVLIEGRSSSHWIDLTLSLALTSHQARSSHRSAQCLMSISFATTLLFE
jgi:hypothetical protein